MVKNIVKDTFFLSQKSVPATEADKQVAVDLLDTLKANSDICAGLAANMIGVNKCVIAVSMGIMDVAMFNPKIVSKSGHYTAQEECLSIDGEHTADRYQEIEIEYQDMNWNTHKRKFTGGMAQVIQHEIDHLSGILI